MSSKTTGKLTPVLGFIEKVQPIVAIGAALIAALSAFVASLEQSNGAEIPQNVE